MKSQVAIVKCRSYEPFLVQEAVAKAINLVGGITNFIKPRSRVLVKPNLLMAQPPESGIDTHPEVVKAVVRVLKTIDCRILVGDGPSIWGSQAEHIDELYERSGMKKVCEEEGVELVKFEKKRMRQNKFPLTTWLDNCDYFVSLPKFKTHNLMILTGAIKNLFGLVWDNYKTELHKDYFKPQAFAGILVDIYQEAKPTLTLVDAIVAMEGEGPATSGKLRNTGFLLAGSDGVALDSVLALVMGLGPLDILTTKEAAVRKLGVCDMDSIDVLGAKLEEVIGKPFKLPAPSTPRTKVFSALMEFASRFIRFYPKINRRSCVLCGACVVSCPAKIMKIKSKRIVIDYSKCLACFCCQEACPSGAIKIKKSIAAKVVGL